MPPCRLYLAYNFCEGTFYVILFTMKTFTYTVHLEPAPEGGYTVTVPALPAIVTEGDTYEEALEMARDAIQLYVESLIADGRPVPEEAPLTHAITTHIEIQAPVSV